jgi:hypothetical protein
VIHRKRRPGDAPPLPLALAPFSLTPLLLMLAAGCTPGDRGPSGQPLSDAPSTAALSFEQQLFWDALQAHCGQAYTGVLKDATPYYLPGLEGRRPVIHFMDCTSERIHIPFHLDADRSRNWILTVEGGSIRLSHDHRQEDGTEDEVSRYGGIAPTPGKATRQIFPADAHTTQILPLRWDNFWFLDFVNESTLEYGVHWPTEGHSVRFAFDLSAPVGAPPRPWGYPTP